MIGPGVNSAARRSAKDYRHLNAPAVVAFGGVVDDLIERARDEVDELKLYDRAKPDRSGCASGADKARFRDGSIDDAVGPELIEKALSDLECAAEHPDVFAEYKH